MALFLHTFDLPRMTMKDVGNNCEVIFRFHQSRQLLEARQGPFTRVSFPCPFPTGPEGSFIQHLDVSVGTEGPRRLVLVEASVYIPAPPVAVIPNSLTSEEGQRYMDYIHSLVSTGGPSDRQLAAVRSLLTGLAQEAFLGSTDYKVNSRPISQLIITPPPVEFFIYGPPVVYHAGMKRPRSDDDDSDIDSPYPPSSSDDDLPSPKKKVKLSCRRTKRGRKYQQSPSFSSSSTLSSGQDLMRRESRRSDRRSSGESSMSIGEIGSTAADVLIYSVLLAGAFHIIRSAAA